MKYVSLQCGLVCRH